MRTFGVARFSAAARASASNPHKYFLLEYTYDAKDMAELTAKRTPLRQAHLAHADVAKTSGLMVLGGAYSEAPMGGLLVFRGSTHGVSRQQVEAFAQADPYVTGKLVSKYTVREWTVVVDGLSGAPQLQ